MVSLDIVIVNWNTGDQLRECLDSIPPARGDGYELNRVVVVDNASVDGSARGLGEIDLPVELISNRDNRGFAAACNQGAGGSASDYLLFLNPDTILFENSLSGPLAFIEKEENRHVGVVGIQLVGEDGMAQRACARFPTPARFLSRTLGLDVLSPRLFPSYRMTDWDHTASREVDQVTGAFFLVPRVLFESAGGFDERFFVYMEELDFSYRIREEGWRSYYMADVKAFHRGGGASERVAARRLFYSIRSRLLYAFKHFNTAEAVLLVLCALVIEPVVRLVFALLKGAAGQIHETLKGYVLLWRELPRIVRRADRQ